MAKPESIPLQGVLWHGLVPLADTDPPGAKRTRIVATQERNFCAIWTVKEGEDPVILDRDPDSMAAIKRAVKLTLKQK